MMRKMDVQRPTWDGKVSLEFFGRTFEKKLSSPARWLLLVYNFQFPKIWAAVTTVGGFKKY